jgi:hypothetical protein
MRVFQKLTAAGWLDTPAQRLAPNDVVQVVDDGTPQGLAPEIVPDPKVYIVCAAPAREGDGVRVALTFGGATVERVVAFTDA